MRLSLTLALVFSLPFVTSNVAVQRALKSDTRCNEVIARDKSHPTWKALDALYGRIAEAVRKKDLDSLFALYAPDFQVKTLDGESWNRDRTLAFLRDVFSQVKETAHTSNTILRLTVCGEDAATATVLQQWYRTQMVAGGPRRVETNAVQDEHWVRTPDGSWKRTAIDDIRDGAAFLDGKRVNPRMPLDPELPAYDPYEPHPRQSIADALFTIIMRKGVESALQSYRILGQSNDYYVTENQLNALGYRLLGMKKVKEAIEIFKLNVEAYPQSSNVYDSLGEAYMINGDGELAIRSYRRAVELNPQNTNAFDMLKKLQAQ
ncbi:MAG: tetratricopeptide repeat protein [Acidobacteria bacterium]|nr:tetratricopeptide repeat protein [Acidobacteriota bacterium]